MSGLIILVMDGLKNSGKMRELLRLIAFQMGNEVSYDELGKQLGMSKNTVEKYLDLLVCTSGYGCVMGELSDKRANQDVS